MTTHRPVTALPTCSKCGDPLEAFQPWSAAILFCPRCNPSKARPVTGPDGDNPITDEQLLELEAVATIARDEDLQTEARAALGRKYYRRGKAAQDQDRTRCAAAYNARHAGKEGR